MGVWVLLLCSLGGVFALDNGLARTPPMGWISWARFYCQIDCQHHPLTCINDRLYMTMADRMAADGYLAAGYDRVNVDDCWMSKQRDANGRLVANATRFPHGISGLVQYIHSKGLKFGIYEDVGSKTCAGYPGSYGHVPTDAKTIVKWGVDMLKFDGCNLNVSLADDVYIDMGQELNKTGHHILYSCEWPLYEFLASHRKGTREEYARIRRTCNLWRNCTDVARSWASILGIIHYYVDNQDLFAEFNGPGGWNDPDMIVVGNPELNVDQSEAQMGIWSLWSAPLFMSNDLRYIDPKFAAILLNRKVIAVDQDPLGKMAKAIAIHRGVYTFIKPMTPVIGANHSYAIGFLNTNRIFRAKINARLTKLGLNHPGGYEIENLFKGTDLGHFKPNDIVSCQVNPTGICLLKATVTRS